MVTRLSQLMIIVIVMTGCTILGSNQYIRFSDIAFSYDDADNPVFSSKLTAMNGQEVVMQGYMAPPLSLDYNFFVITKVPVFACPFCTNTESWDGQYVVIYMDDWLYEEHNPVEVRGILEIGPRLDEEIGLVSYVRIQATTITVLN